MCARSAVALTVALVAGACDDEPTWRVVGEKLDAGLLSIWGSAEDDVYAVGADSGDGQGPLVLHYDGARWERLVTGATGTLWWIHGFSNGGPIFMGGDGGTILRYEGGAFSRMTTPGNATVFGIWGPTPDDLWAVGGAIGGARGAFAWRLAGDAWVEAVGFPANLPDTTALWKVHGRSATDAWMVGTNGRSVRWDGSTLTEVSTGAGESLFTVHADDAGYVAVGGFGTGAIFANETGAWRNISPPRAPALIGVVLDGDGGGYAVGEYSAMYRRHGDTWQEESSSLYFNESLHAVWIDPAGGVWTVGGQISMLPLTDGLILYKGSRDPGRIP